MKRFIVCIKDCYVRDVQVLLPSRPLTEKEYDNLDNKDYIEIEGAHGKEGIEWRDMTDCEVFLGNCTANDEEEAREIAAKEFKIPINALIIHEIKEFKKGRFKGEYIKPNCSNCISMGCPGRPKGETCDKWMGIHITSSPDKIYIEIMGEGTTYDCTDKNDVVEAIIDEYHRNDVCIGELMNQIQVHGLSTQDVVDVFAKVMNIIEGDEVIHHTPEENYTNRWEW